VAREWGGSWCAQLVAEARYVAMRDVWRQGMAEAQRLCDRFRDEEADRHDTDRIHPLFNNAGVGNSGSMIAHSREEWKPTFTICCTRAFLAMLQKAS